MKKTDTCLNIVSTPIGNLRDISERAIETIKGADFVICENPKHSLKLLNKLGIKKKLIPMHDYNEKEIIKRLSNEIHLKKSVLISDAGSPLISDPGYKLIQYCIKNKINITSIPGATSLIPALQLSGIPINSFSFFGFFPKNKKQISIFINEIKNHSKTIIFFLSSHKIKQCIEVLEKEINDRQICISKELTKLNEKVFRGLIKEIKNEIYENKENLKGEFVVVIEGIKQDNSNFSNIEDYGSEINKLLLKFSLTDVVEIVHKLSGLNKNKLYKWILAIKKS